MDTAPTRIAFAPRGRLSGLLWLVAAALLFAPSSVWANPDIWVKWKLIYVIENEKAVGLSLEWRFDQYFSSRIIGENDDDGDGALSDTEVERLRKQVFEPLAEHHYFLHLLADEERQGFQIRDYRAAVEDGTLVYRFKVTFDQAIDYRRDAMVVSQHDDRVVVDFDFAQSPFLLVEGQLDPGCKFRIGRGRDSLSGHDKTITLLCEG